ncbi:hypothetical protein PP178_02840 [Zeaxanthinibacter sp. PT1]|uniref:hypothetical protein n=1 Tax=Zeaxanthinibacter TaxID=561554 RepID=UPI00234AE64D|nr:hypothetical protein [Zeaxanthinibacter sp. PT1]MDC6350473.1 hypothetical protein [Zeaxanthinibacter sp. PT1]
MNLEEYFLAIDTRIKGLILELASYNNVSVEFAGYLIENNNKSYCGSPRPLYNTFREYRKKNEYEELTHIRYFFHLTKNENKCILTIHLSNSALGEIHFSIEELGGGVKVPTPESLRLSDFSLLMSYVQEKFN